MVDTVETIQSAAQHISSAEPACPVRGQQAGDAEADDATGNKNGSAAAGQPFGHYPEDTCTDCAPNAGFFSAFVPARTSKGHQNMLLLNECSANKDY